MNKIKNYIVYDISSLIEIDWEDHWGFGQEAYVPSL